MIIIRCSHTKRSEQTRKNHLTWHRTKATGASTSVVHCKARQKGVQNLILQGARKIVASSLDEGRLLAQSCWKLIGVNESISSA